MTPLIETISLVVIAIVVLLLVVWVFGLGKSPKKEIPVGDSSPRETSKPTAHAYKVFVACDLPDSKVGKKVYHYERTNTFFRTKDGDYYELIKSNYGGVFYIKDGQRKYLTDKEKEAPTFSRAEVLDD